MRRLFIVLVIAAAVPLASSRPCVGAASLRPDPGEESRCGFWKVADADRSPASSAAVRPAPGPDKIGSAHFLVHYNGAGFAAYAQDIVDASELAYRVLIDTIGHMVPPSDGVQGGDARTDVYLRTVAQMGGNVYGRTLFETITGSPYAASSTSWIEILDTLALKRRQIVAVHEFYHVIQVGYDRNESVSLLEMLSTWIEDRVYSYHLNLPTLQLFFRWPYRGLFSQLYTNSPWAIYLTEKYGDAILAETMARCGETPGPNPREAFNGALSATEGTTFLDEFIAFGTFNYFTGYRDDGAHYSEGAIYRPVTVEKRSECYPFLLYITPVLPAELGASYYVFDGDGHSDPLRLRIVPDYLATSMITVTRFKGASRTTATTYYAAMSPEDTLSILDWSECDSLLAIYQVDTGAAMNTFAIEAFYERPPAPAGAWVLVLDRDACRAPFDGVDDEFTVRDGGEFPIAQALRANGAVVVVSDTIPASVVGCSAVFVVGGFDDTGVTLTDDILLALDTFVDTGGDLYVEGSRLGGLLAAGTPVEQDFWNRFGTAFADGNALGNVASWNTLTGALLGDHTFSYDPGDPDSLVGVLVPGTASPLIEDGAGTVRATAMTSGSSTRVMSTVLLGGSTGTGASTRAAYMNDIMTLFGVNLATLSVARANLSVDGRDVVIRGVLEHYDDERLELARVDAESITGVVLVVEHVGGEWRFSAHDRMPGDAAVYRLVDATHTRVLWEEHARASAPAFALRLERVYPNPARDGVHLVIESGVDTRASIGVFDVAGRRVAEERASLRQGTNLVFMRTPFGSGHYFVRVQTGDRHVGGRFSVIR